MEIWKDVIGYEGLYQVSNYGNVMALKKDAEYQSKIIQGRPQRVLRQHMNMWGYMKVWLYKDGKRKEHAVHRLVASAFISNLDNKPCVNHIDNNKSNNHLENLEWCTYQENSDWSKVQGRRKITEEWRNKIISTRETKAVIGTDKDGKEYYFDKVRGVTEMGFDLKAVIDCCKGRRTSTKGFTWRYKADGGAE